jgi:hypothetical protein
MRTTTGRRQNLIGGAIVVVLLAAFVVVTAVILSSAGVSEPCCPDANRSGEAASGKVSRFRPATGEQPARVKDRRGSGVADAPSGEPTDPLAEPGLEPAKPTEPGEPAAPDGPGEPQTATARGDGGQPEAGEPEPPTAGTSRMQPTDRPLASLPRVTVGAVRAVDALSPPVDDPGAAPVLLADRVSGRRDNTRTADTPPAAPRPSPIGDALPEEVDTAAAAVLQFTTDRLGSDGRLPAGAADRRPRTVFDTSLTAYVVTRRLPADAGEMRVTWWVEGAPAPFRDVIRTRNDRWDVQYDEAVLADGTWPAEQLFVFIHRASAAGGAADGDESAADRGTELLAAGSLMLADGADQPAITGLVVLHQGVAAAPGLTLPGPEAELTLRFIAVATGGETLDLRLVRMLDAGTVAAESIVVPTAPDPAAVSVPVTSASWATGEYRVELGRDGRILARSEFVLKVTGEHAAPKPARPGE